MILKVVTVWVVISLTVSILDAFADAYAWDDGRPEGSHLLLLVILLLVYPLILPRDYLIQTLGVCPPGHTTDFQWYSWIIAGDLIVCLFYLAAFMAVALPIRFIVRLSRNSG
jgi:hypothetical protein